MNQLVEVAYLKQKIIGSQKNYEAYTVVQQLKLQNLRDPKYYSLPVDEQIKMDLKLLKEQIDLMNKIKPQQQVYKFLPSLGYGPGYVLAVHQLYFRQYQKYSSKGFKDLEAIRNMSVLGGIFDKRVRSDLKKVQNNSPIKAIYEGKNLIIKMDNQQWFYSRFTSIHISAAIVLVQAQNNIFPVYIRLRQNNGHLLANVKTKFFGFNISSQHNLIGFNLNNYVIEPFNFLNNNWKYSDFNTIQNKIEHTELFFSFLDLCKSCNITMLYTSMRKQFKTIPDSKQQRRIIEYQAVASRIAEGLATTFMISSLLNHYKPGFTDYYQYGHKIIFNQLVTLRQCCGGFGYLKASGHPLLIERVALRASEANPNPTPISKLTLRQYSPYVNSTDSNVNFQYSKQKPRTPSNYYFITSQYHFLQPKSKIQQSQYIYDFVKSCCIQLFQKFQNWNSFKKNITNILQLCKYMCIIEGLKQSKYIRMDIMSQKTKQEVLETMIRMKLQALSIITKDFEQFRKSLPELGMQDVIIGRDNEDNFYEEVLKISKEGYRNSKQFIDEVKKPIVEYLRNGNAGNL